MKHSKSILMAALAAVSIGSASAETIYLSGSTAFRSAANAAIVALSTNSLGNTNGLLAIDNAAIGSAGNMLVQYVDSGVTNLIDVHWSGSEAGIQSTAGPTSGTNAKKTSFFPTNATGWTNSVYTNPANNSQVSEICFSDTFQSTSRFNGLHAGDGVNYSTLSGFDGADGIAGVVTFTWATSPGAGITNVTSQQARQLLINGGLPKVVFTGNTSDSNSFVWDIGRNIDSGTRLSTFAETGLGVLSPVKQYTVNATNSIYLTIIESIDGISSGTAGNSGYSSGGTLCGFLTNTYASGSAFKYGTLATNSSAAAIAAATNSSAYASNFLAGYAGVSDANGKVSSGLVEVGYNGVAFSQTNVENGQYSFWGYEHVYQNPAADTAVSDFATALGNYVAGETDSQLFPNVSVNNMQCGRNVDGGTIYSSY